jgi:Spy/CpxP family protein refolding chaperone
MTARAQLVIAIFAAFLFGTSLGAVAGFGVARLVQTRAFAEGWRERRGPPPERDRTMMIRLHRGLNLTTEQRERIHEILEGSRPRYAAIRESTRAAIESELTPEQRERWSELEERFRDQRGHRRMRMRMRR